MKLYHFTAGRHLRGIADCGLTVGDVPTDLVNNKGTVGVWLTTAKIPQGHGLNSSRADKARYRLTVDVPDNGCLQRWPEWAIKNVTAQTRASLHVADGHQDATWYVYFGRISPDQILAVTDMQSGMPVVDWRTVWPASDSDAGVRYDARFIWHNRLLRDVRNAVRNRTKLAR